MTGSGVHGVAPGYLSSLQVYEAWRLSELDTASMNVITLNRLLLHQPIE